MKARYSPDFYRQYKKANIRIRSSVDKRVKIFIRNPHDPQLNNHALRYEYEGCRSIDITPDWRAIYEEVKYGNETVAYFIIIGTHKELY